MSIRTPSILTILIFCLLLLIGVNPLSAVEKSADQLFPQSTVVYAEIPQPGKLVSTIYDHPLLKHLQTDQTYRQAFDNPKLKQFKQVVGFMEKEMKADWRSSIDAVSHGGIYFGVDYVFRGVAVLAKGKDENSPKKLRDAILKLIRATEKNNNKSKIVKELKIDNIKAHKIGDVYLIVLKRWLIVTNKEGLGSMIVFNYHQKKPACLANNETYQIAKKTKIEKPTAWAFADLKMIRTLLILNEFLSDKKNDLFQEFILGGVKSVLKNTPYATLTIKIDQQKLQLIAAVPYDPKYNPKERAYYFGADGKGAAPPMLIPKNTLFSWRIHRDLASLWLNAPELIDEKTNADLAKAQSQLTLFFSGRDFSREVLGSVKPQFQIVTVRQEYEKHKIPTPEVKLPAGAILFQLKEPKKTGRFFKVAFQSIVGFANIIGSQNKFPMLEMNTESYKGGTLLSASYSAEDSKNPKKAKIYFNTSPSLAIVGDQLIIASTSQLARELIALSSKDKNDKKTTKEGAVVNTEIYVNLTNTLKILTDNRQHLIANNMLEKGHDKKTAEKEIDTLLELGKWLKDTNLNLKTENKMLKLEFKLNLNTPKK